LIQSTNILLSSTPSATVMSTLTGQAVIHQKGCGCLHLSMGAQLLGNNTTEPRPGKADCMEPSMLELSGGRFCTATLLTDFLLFDMPRVEGVHKRWDQRNHACNPIPPEVWVQHFSKLLLVVNKESVCLTKLLKHLCIHSFLPVSTCKLFFLEDLHIPSYCLLSTIKRKLPFLCNFVLVHLHHSLDFNKALSIMFFLFSISYRVISLLQF
jgi:hypothetical protein